MQVSRLVVGRLVGLLVGCWLRTMLALTGGIGTAGAEAGSGEDGVSSWLSTQRSGWVPTNGRGSVDHTSELRVGGNKLGR